MNKNLKILILIGMFVILSKSLIAGGEPVRTYSSIDLSTVKKVSLSYEFKTDLNIPAAEIKIAKIKNIQRITQMLKNRGIQVVGKARYSLVIETHATAVPQSFDYQTTTPETTYHSGYGKGGYVSGTSTTYKKETNTVNYNQIVTISKSRIFQGKEEIAVTETPQSERFGWDSVSSISKEETVKIIENYFGAIADEKILD